METNQQKTHRLYEEVWNSGRLDLIADWVTPAFVGHWSMIAEPVQGVEGFRAVAKELLAALPDARFEVLESIEADDKVASRVRITGTHLGPMQGFAPTGKSVTVEYLAIEHYRDGKVFQEWVFGNDVDVSRQIGALPRAGSTGERIGQKLFALKAARMRRR